LQLQGQNVRPVPFVRQNRFKTGRRTKRVEPLSKETCLAAERTSCSEVYSAVRSFTLLRRKANTVLFFIRAQDGGLFAVEKIKGCRK